MEICLGKIHEKPVVLELKDGIVYIDGEAEPIKGITGEDLEKFNAEMALLEDADNPPDGNEAMANAIRAAFLSRLLGHAVGDECISRLTHILDHVHYDVLKYLGEVEEED